MIRLVRAPNPGPFTLDGTNSWVIGSSAVVDPGPAIESHVEAILAAAPSLTTVLLTHRHGDHAPAADLLAARAGCRVLAPPGVVNEHVDVRISEGQRVEIEGLELEVVATPGHTEEHVCFLTAGGDLFTGDMILGEGTTTIFPPDGRMREYLASLRKLRTRLPRRIYPGHGPIRDDAVELIDFYIAHRLDRERQILLELSDGERSIPELRWSIYPDIPPGLHTAAEAQLRAHLIHLIQQNEVREEAGRFLRI